MSNNKDNINPDHYQQGGIQTIDYIEAKLPQPWFKGFLIGNIIKYVSRCFYKGGLEDLKKAQWYLQKLINEMEDEQLKEEEHQKKQEPKEEEEHQKKQEPKEEELRTSYTPLGRGCRPGNFAWCSEIEAKNR